RVVRPNQEFRGYAGSVASGRIAVGDKVVVLPSGRETTVSSIITWDGGHVHAHAGQSVTITLADDLDVTRGDLIACVERSPAVATAFDATVVWLAETPAEIGKRYRLKHNTLQQWADVKTIRQRININTLEGEMAQTLEMNEIGAVRIEAARPIVFDSYIENRTTGSFILIDPVTNATVAAGLIAGAALENTATRARHEITWHARDGALVVSIGGNQNTAPRALDDPEALAALKTLVERLGLPWSQP
ncbi:MAG: hypothetical protein JO091_01000, partial [Acidobacteriaceae bacterium]|nr:hypothetical protein [Acidobacteriaceae bacterium]